MCRPNREFDRRQVRDLMNHALKAKAVMAGLEKALEERFDMRDRAAAEAAEAEASLNAAGLEYERLCDTIGELLAARNEEGAEWSSPHDGRTYAALLDSNGSAVVGRVVPLGRLIDKGAGDGWDDEDEDEDDTEVLSLPTSASLRITGREPSIVNNRPVVPVAEMIREVDEAREAVRGGPAGHAADYSTVRDRLKARLGDPQRLRPAPHQAHPTACVESTHESESVVTNGAVS